MALPEDVTTFELTFGPYTDAAGEPVFAGMTGKIKPSFPQIRHVESGAVVIDSPIPVEIDGFGVASVQLAHTDQAVLSPVGFTYSVVWDVASRKPSPGNKQFAVPASAGAVVDFDLLAPSPDVEGVVVPLTFGKSAYDLAVENGFVGTEDAWLASLRGPVGEVSEAELAAGLAAKVSRIPVVQTVTPSGDATGATDAAAINAAIAAVSAAGGGTVRLGGAAFKVNTSILMATNVRLEGTGGVSGTTITLAAGANCDVISHAGFAALTTTGSAGGLGAAAFARLVIDGNRTNQTGPSWGIRVYGYNLTFDEVTIRNAYSDGLYTEWGGMAAGAPTDSMEARYRGIKIHDCGGWGWHNRGPHDSTADEIIIWSNNQTAGNAGGLWIEDDATNSNYLAGAFQMSNSHIWGVSHNWGIVNDSALYAVNLQNEGAKYGQLLNRGTLVMTGGRSFYLTGFAGNGCGIQMGDDGTAPGTPTIFAHVGAGWIDHALNNFIGVTPATAPVRWVNGAGQVKALCSMPTWTVAAASNGQTITALTGGQLAVSTTQRVPAAGTALVQTSTGHATISWTGVTSTHLTGVTVATGTGTVSTGGFVMGTALGGTTADPNSQVDLVAMSSTSSAGMRAAASVRYMKGVTVIDGGASSGGFKLQNNGGDEVGWNFAARRMELIKGWALRGYSDQYTTTTYWLEGAKGHVGFAPVGTVGSSARTAAGTTPPAPVVQAGSSDVAGQVQMGTGTAPAAGDQVLINFAQSWVNAPWVTIAPANAATAALQPYVSSVNTAGLIIAFAVAPAASQAASTYAINYQVTGRPN